MTNYSDIQCIFNQKHPTRREESVFAEPEPSAEAWQEKTLTLFSNSDITGFEETNKLEYYSF